MRYFRLPCAGLFLLIILPAVLADEPKPTPQNTISIKLPEPVKPQTFPKPVKFFVDNVIDRSGSPRPMLVYEGRGGIFIDREPTEIIRQALTDTLKTAGLLADDKASANYILNLYVFHFGLASGSGAEYFGKVDLNVVVKDTATGKSQEVTALGTYIKGTAILKKNILKNVEENIDGALQDSLRNFLRGTKLRNVVVPPEGNTPAPPAVESTPK